MVRLQTRMSGRQRPAWYKKPRERGSMTSPATQVQPPRYAQHPRSRGFPNPGRSLRACVETSLMVKLRPSCQAINDLPGTKSPVNGVNDQPGDPGTASSLRTASPFTGIPQPRQVLEGPHRNQPHGKTQTIMSGHQRPAWYKKPREQGSMTSPATQVQPPRYAQHPRSRGFPNPGRSLRACVGVVSNITVAIRIVHLNGSLG